MSEAIDEAWIALRAAEEAQRRLAEGKGPQREADEAETRAAEGDQRFIGLGETALARAGASAPGCGGRGDDLHLWARRGRSLCRDRGNGAQYEREAERKVDSLMVAFVDRLELPLSSIAIDAGLVLAPGETKEFSQRLQARGGTARATQMTFGASRPARHGVRAHSAARYSLGSARRRDVARITHASANKA